MTVFQWLRLGQSVWAIVTGFLFFVILSIVADTVVFLPPLHEFTPVKTPLSLPLPLALSSASSVAISLHGWLLTAPCATLSSAGASAWFWPLSAPPRPGTATSALTGIPSH